MAINVTQLEVPTSTNCFNNSNNKSNYKCIISQKSKKTAKTAKTATTATTATTAETAITATTGRNCNNCFGKPTCIKMSKHIIIFLHTNSRIVTLQTYLLHSFYQYSLLLKLV